MIDLLTTHDDEIAALCRRFGATRLDVFGSAATAGFDPERSDVDLLVELEPPAGVSRFEAYFGLKEALEELFGRSVDLVERSALRNPYVLADVERGRQTIYAA